MSKPSRAERLRYVFDNFMARGTIALIAGLFLVAAVGVLIITVAVAILARPTPRRPSPTCSGTA